MTECMKAAVLDRYGPPEVLRIEEVDLPVPAADEVQVRVHAATVNRNDCAWRRAHPFFQRAFSGWRRPKGRILGDEFAGTVAEVGSGVTRFAVGDEVFGVRAYLNEGLGCQAEYLTARETSGIANKPSNVSFEEAAAACDGALSALPFLRKAGVGPDTRVMIYGASGAIGSAAVQLARHLAAEVTAFAGARNLELVKSLGATETLDYAQHDPAETDRPYDVIFDSVGKLSFLRVRRALTPRGAFGSAGGLLNFAMCRSPPAPEAAASSSPCRPSRSRTCAFLPSSWSPAPSARSSTAPTRSTRWSTPLATSRPSARPATLS
jgi:NADPH:quinone reductase-like Zn-dependent oxidoreductase